LILDGGPTPGGLESTVLDVTASPPRLLRPGLVTPAAIESVVGLITQTVREGGEADKPLPSPGMLARHYAPRAVLECAEDGGERVEALCRAGRRVGWLAFAVDPGKERPGLTTVLMPREPAAYAARLYAVLHALDDAGVERVVADLPPDAQEWLAVRDRLRRASAAPVI
jgi:L-threonylcarbamoyladenylate synthase